MYVFVRTEEDDEVKVELICFVGVCHIIKSTLNENEDEIPLFL